MPTYIYKCRECSNEKEVTHGFNDEPELSCDQCGNGMRKSISAATVLFVGNGFYVNDSKSTKMESRSVGD